MFFGKASVNRMISLAAKEREYRLGIIEAAAAKLDIGAANRIHSRTVSLFLSLPTVCLEIFFPYIMPE
jgi:hypothetical protein